MSDDLSTRRRLIDAAMTLFASGGFAATTVGDIEQAAGRAPRSGALYTHFPSKLAVLEAGLQLHLASVRATAEDLALMPLGDLRIELELLGWWLLAELDRERELTHVLEREGDRLPEWRDRVRAEISDRGYGAAAAFVARWAADLRLPTEDHEALAVLLVGMLVNVRRSAWTFGAEPLGVDDDRAVAAFVAVGTTVLQQRR